MSTRWVGGWVGGGHLAHCRMLQIAVLVRHYRALTYSPFIPFFLRHPITYQGHALALHTTEGSRGTCDSCLRSLKHGTNVMDCTPCDYFLCSSCDPRVNEIADKGSDVTAATATATATRIAGGGAISSTTINEGDEVEVQQEDGSWEAATVVRRDRSVVDVKYDDGGDVEEDLEILLVRRRKGGGGAGPETYEDDREYKMGDKVQVQDEDGEWEDARVSGVGGAGIEVTYTLNGDVEEDVGLEHIRSGDSTTNANSARTDVSVKSVTDVAVGDDLEARNHDGEWEDAMVVAVHGIGAQHSYLTIRYASSGEVEDNVGLHRVRKIIDPSLAEGQSTAAPRPKSLRIATTAATDLQCMKVSSMFAKKRRGVYVAVQIDAFHKVLRTAVTSEQPSGKKRSFAWPKPREGHRGLKFKLPKEKVKKTRSGTKMRMSVLEGQLVVDLTVYERTLSKAGVVGGGGAARKTATTGGGDRVVGYGRILIRTSTARTQTEVALFATQAEAEEVAELARDQRGSGAGGGAEAVEAADASKDTGETKSKKGKKGRKGSVHRSKTKTASEKSVGSVTILAWLQ